MGMKKRLQTALTVASLGGLLGACAPTPEQAAPINSAIPDGSLDPYVAHKDTRSGLPTFVWLTPRPTDPVGKDATEVAWRVLRELSATYRMSAAAMQTVQLKTMHDQGHGAILAQFAQQVDGLEVFLHGVTVTMDQSLRPVAASGNFAPAVRRTAADFAHPPSDAIAAALQQVIGGSLPTETIITKGPAQSPKDRYTQFAVAPVVLANQTYTLAAPARTKQVLFAGPQGLIPSYYVELGVRARQRVTGALAVAGHLGRRQRGPVHQGSDRLRRLLLSGVGRLQRQVHPPHQPLRRRFHAPPDGQAGRQPTDGAAAPESGLSAERPV